MSEVTEIKDSVTKLMNNWDEFKKSNEERIAKLEKNRGVAEYEEKLENNKRTIFVLKPRYLNVVKDDLEEIMTYEKGSTQYVSGTLKRADNIRLYT